MSVQTVAVLAPGEMGHAVGAVLRHGGLRVLTSLAGRSPQTVQRAKTAGLEAAEDDAALVRDAEVLFSIVPPAEAVGLARRIAAALRGSRATLLFVDCNAISPTTTRQVGDIVTAAGATFVDGGIIGPPPKPGEGKTRLYVSGADAGRVTELCRTGLDIRAVDGGIGAASALKMSYASMTKGMMALATAALVTAEKLGVSGALRSEMQISRADVLADIDRNLPRVPPKAYRWIAEMEEIAATFGDAGLPAEVFQGIARVFQMVADSPLGHEAPGARGRAPTVADYVTVMAAQTGAKHAAE